MTKPNNPGQGNGNGNERSDDASHVVIVETDERQHRFEGTGTMAVNGGCLLVGKGPSAAFSDGTWIRAWVETLTPAPVEP